jgi:hypothetical protein
VCVSLSLSLSSFSSFFSFYLIFIYFLFFGLIFDFSKGGGELQLPQTTPLDPPMDSVASNSDNGKNGKIRGNYFPLKKVHI